MFPSRSSIAIGLDRTLRGTPCNRKPLRDWYCRPWCFLITTNEGHILINTTRGFYTLIKANIVALELEFQNIRILVTTQAHFDHAAALAEIKLLTTHEQVTPGDTPVLQMAA